MFATGILARADAKVNDGFVFRFGAGLGVCLPPGPSQQEIAVKAAGWRSGASRSEIERGRHDRGMPSVAVGGEMFVDGRQRMQDTLAKVP